MSTSAREGPPWNLNAPGRRLRRKKQRLDQLAENNTAIVTLIKAHSPHAKMAVFKTEADKFRNYASVWRDRWNSVMCQAVLDRAYGKPHQSIDMPQDAFPGLIRVEFVEKS
jgi:hypothetical protein